MLQEVNTNVHETHFKINLFRHKNENTTVVTITDAAVLRLKVTVYNLIGTSAKLPFWL